MMPRVHVSLPPRSTAVLVMLFGIGLARTASAADGRPLLTGGTFVLGACGVAVLVWWIWTLGAQRSALRTRAATGEHLVDGLLDLLSEDVDVCTTPILGWIAQRMGADRSSLALSDPVHGSVTVHQEWTVETVSTTADPARRLEPGRYPTLIGAAMDGTRVLVADTSRLTSGDRLLVEDRAAAGVAVLPLAHGSTPADRQVIGLVIVETIGRPLSCTHSELDTVQPILSGLAAALVRQRREDELRRLASAVEQSPVSVLITTPEGIIEYVNPRFCETTGYSESDAIGKTPRIIKSNRNDPSVYADLWQTISSGHEWRGELINRRRNGELYWEAVSISPLTRPDGTITHYIAVTQDVTPRKETLAELRRAKDEADRASRAKDEFLANMSHEIRTPVNAIVGMTHLALQTELSQRQHDYLTKIRGSSQTLLGIINNILDFSRISAGKMVIDAVDFRLDDVTDNLRLLLASKAEEKGLHLVLETSPEVPPVLRGDPVRLGQILVNLGNNAVKFTDTGTVTISTELLHLDADTAVLRFAVRDTGIGLSTEQLQRMFEPFAQADGSTTRKFGGTGLGLAISQRLVELMGGEISADSELGVGSIFTFTATFGRHQGTDARDVRLPKDLHGTRVLVVDDSQTAAQMLTEVLTGLQLEATAVATSEAALAQVARAEDEGAPFRAVLMDWNLPGMNGLQTARVLKAGTGLRHVPAVILMTAYGREDVVRSADDAVLDGFLLKPVSPGVLADALLAALGRPPRETEARDQVGSLEADRGPPLHRARVLLVEDNSINQEVASELLEELGADVEAVGDGAQAVMAARRRPFDLILMDIQMPVMDGYNATAEIRRRGLRPDVPIVAMTAHALSGDRERCLATGMDDYISKPIELDRLREVVTRWLGPLEPTGPAGRTDELEAQPQLAQLQEIDLDDALRRLRGNQKLLTRLLREFRHDYKDAVATLRTAIELNHLDSARRLVHTLKGVAGSVGAHAVQKASSSLEAALSSGDHHLIAEAVDTLDAALGRVLVELDGLPDAHAPLSIEGEVAREHLESLLDVLADLLAQGDAEASECLDRIVGTVSADVMDQMSELIEHVESFDYDDALRALGTLRTQLQLGERER